MKFKLEELTTIDDRIIIDPHPEIKFTKEVEIPIQSNVNPSGYTLEKRKQEFPANYRTGKVITLPIGWDEEKTGIKKGDIVVFEAKSAQPLELIKDVVFIRKYNITGVIQKK